MTNTQRTPGPFPIPDGLPVPVDDGAADHLTGLRMPAISLRSTSGARVDLSALPGRVVVYAYPKTGVPGIEMPQGWDNIPGARGCTPQTLSFQAEQEVFAAFGVKIFGLSTQTPEYQKELSDRLGLSFQILSDAEFQLADALRLPILTVAGMRLLKRLTLIIKDGVIEHVFYPVFPSDRSAAEVIAWLQEKAAPTHDAGVLIYTAPGCRYCQAAKAFLSEKGVAFIEVDVDCDQAAAKVMVARSGGQRTVPQIFIGATHVGGVDELKALARSGRLEAWLAGNMMA